MKHNSMSLSLASHWKEITAFIVIGGTASAFYIIHLTTGPYGSVIGVVERAGAITSSQYDLPSVVLQVRLPDGTLVKTSIPHSQAIRIGQQVELQVYRRMWVGTPSYVFERYASQKSNP